MSGIKRILVTLGGGAADPSVLAEALRIASAQAAELAAVHVRETFPVEVMMTADAAAYAIEQIRASEEAALARVEALLTPLRSSTTRAVPLYVEQGDFAGAVANLSTAFDLVVTGQHDPDRSARWTLDAQERLLMQACAPVYFVPFIARTQSIPAAAPPAEAVFRRVLVAWTTAREASVALRAALPLIADAEAVQIVTYARDTALASQRLERVADYLRSHGIAAEARAIAWREPSIAARLIGADDVDAPVAESLLSLAADCAADLLVMGAYGHSRAWEIAVGGVTHTILRSMTLPVLMMH